MVVNVSTSIDAVFSILGAQLINASILHKYPGVGNHIVYIVNFTAESAIGDVFNKCGDFLTT